MKTKIIPAIDVKTKKELEKELKLVSFVDKVHIDIMDGRFVSAKTITAKEVNSLKETPKIQIHLMSFNVLEQLRKFKQNDIKKVQISGCNFAAVTSAIFNSKNVKKIIKELS